MGNQATHLHQAAQHQPSSVPPSSEPLESFMKEKQRDEHLKNLGFKRSKSIRRSISKKLRGAIQLNFNQLSNRIFS